MVQVTSAPKSTNYHIISDEIKRTLRIKKQAKSYIRGAMIGQMDSPPPPLIDIIY